jgi:RNA polymerase sigma-70 factor (ECF subfamily)
LDPQAEITGLLKAWGGGDKDALAVLTALVYEELRRLARRSMRHEHPGQTLQTTALVNEAWLRLADGKRVDWQDRAHFFAVSSRLMRRILVDAARARQTGKRGGQVLRFELNESIDAGLPRDRELIALDDALEALARLDPRKVRIIEMRFFGGLSVVETAAVLRISPQSVLRDWKLARAWLLREISG